MSLPKRWSTLLLLALLVILQYPLWLGRGGWLEVSRMQQRLQNQEKLNAELESRNTRLEAEVQNLEQSFEAIEERARYEIGYTKPNEYFVRTPRLESKQNLTDSNTKVIPGNKPAPAEPGVSPVTSLILDQATH